MPYSTASDIAPQQDLIDLTDDTGSGSADSTHINAAIGRADRLIDSYLRGRYNVPFSPAPPEITRMSATLAKYFLYERRGMVSEAVKREHELTMAYLKDLGAHKASLDETDQSADIDRSTSRILSNKTDQSAVFSKSVLDRY